MKDLSTIGKRIFAKRVELGLTQQQLSEKSLIAIPTISNIEGDKRMPSIDTLIQLAPVLNCSIDYILLGKEGTAPLEIRKQSKEEKILRAVATLIETNEIYVHGETDWQGNYSVDSYLDFVDISSKKIILQFAEQVEKLLSLKKSTKIINTQFDKLIDELIESNAKNIANK